MGNIGKFIQSKTAKWQFSHPGFYPQNISDRHENFRSSKLIYELYTVSFINIEPRYKVLESEMKL